MRRLAIAITLLLGMLAVSGSASAAPSKHKNSGSSSPTPTVAISAPANAATVSGTTTVTGSASDSSGIAKVQIAIDSSTYQPATGTTSWTYSLDTTALSNGSHTITALATDTLGNSRTASISVSVNNSSSGGGTTGGSNSGFSAIWYVSRNGNNADGTSWATAWNELSRINWNEVKAGDTILVDGGGTSCTPVYTFATTRPGVNCGMEYDTALTVGVSGVTIRLASDSGRNGTAVIFGGRATPLPYCHQTNYSGSMVGQYGVVVNGVDHVTIDGAHISGFMVYGWDSGVYVENSAGSNLFERLEVFDNGVFYASSGGGVVSDDPGFWLGASPNTVLRGDIVHDNGQDEIQDNTRPVNSLNGLVLDTDWLFASRENPAHPGEPFNDLQEVGDNTCQHSDGLQFWNGGSSQSNLTVMHSLFGPLTDQGLYPSDGGSGVTWNNVSVTDSLFLNVRHSIINDNPVNGWTVDHDTLFAEQGGFELPSDGANTITNIVKYNGYVYTPSWTGTTSGNVWYLGDPLPGSSTNQDPDFVGPVPGGTLNGYAAYAAAVFAPQCAACQGSSLHSLGDIVHRIEGLA